MTSPATAAATALALTVSWVGLHQQRTAMPALHPVQFGQGNFNGNGNVGNFNGNGNNGNFNGNGNVGSFAGNGNPGSFNSNGTIGALNGNGDVASNMGVGNVGNVGGNGSRVLGGGIATGFGWLIPWAGRAPVDPRH